jgi:hypothetical protein
LTWFIENLYNPFMKIAILIGVLIIGIVPSETKKDNRKSHKELRDLIKNNNKNK